MGGELSPTGYQSIRQEQRAARRQTAKVSRARQAWGMVGKNDRFAVSLEGFESWFSG